MGRDPKWVKEGLQMTSSIRYAVFSLISLGFVVVVSLSQGQAQNSQQMQSPFTAQYVPAVFGGSVQSGWYSYPGEQPRLHIRGDEIRVRSQRDSTVLLSRVVDPGADAEVSLVRAPISTSSISGLAVLRDQRHALVIGLSDGAVVLWQLDPAGARMIARQPVNANDPLEFRVTGETAANIRFFWRHVGDSSWHPLLAPEANQILARWQSPLKFGLLLDGPLGSEATFRNYRSANPSVASLQMPNEY
jgi:hypothetical protein